MTEGGRRFWFGGDAVCRVMWLVVVPWLVLASFALMFATYAYATQGSFGIPSGGRANGARGLVVVMLWAGIAAADLRRASFVGGGCRRARIVLSVYMSGLCAVGLLIVIEMVVWAVRLVVI